MPKFYFDYDVIFLGILDGLSDVLALLLIVRVNSPKKQEKQHIEDTHI